MYYVYMFGMNKLIDMFRDKNVVRFLYIVKCNIVVEH